MPLPLSLSTSTVHPLKAEAAFIAAQRAGYSAVELMVTPSRDTQNPHHIQNLIQKYSIPVTTIHAPTLLLCKFVWGTDPAFKLERSVKHAEQIGAQSVVVHPPFKNNPYSKKFLNHVNTLQKTTQVQICVENMFPWAGTEFYGPSWEETLDAVPYLTFDFSHAALSGMNVLEFFSAYHHKVKVIHLTDGTTRHTARNSHIHDEHMLPGEGDMPIREVYDILIRNKWVGETVLEVNTRKYRTLPEKLYPLRKSINFFNETTTLLLNQKVLSEAPEATPLSSA